MCGKVSIVPVINGILVVVLFFILFFSCLGSSVCRFEHAFPCGFVCCVYVPCGGGLWRALHFYFHVFDFQVLCSVFLSLQLDRFYFVLGVEFVGVFGSRLSVKCLSSKGFCFCGAMFTDKAFTCLEVFVYSAVYLCCVWFLNPVN